MPDTFAVADPAALGFDPARLRRLDATFARYVDDGRLPGWQLVVSRRGQVAHHATYGLRDPEAGLPVTADTLWRIYSMTKPITTVAAMTLFEEGAFELSDPIAQWLPEFAAPRVWAGGTAVSPQTVPAIEPIRVGHLLSHTSGLTYGFLQVHPVDALYRAAGSDLTQKSDVDLETQCRVWAQLPLLFQPGSAWGYSVATDVLGRLLEVLTGKPLDAVIAERVLDPLGMTDTTWWVDAQRADRLARLCVADPASGRAVVYDAMGRAATREPRLLGGGGGLVSSAADYQRFADLLLGGGARDGVRLLSNRTLAMMTRNHLPDGGDIARWGSGSFSEGAYHGTGFGLGFSVLLDPVRAGVLGSAGDFGWGGLASTTFWVDPAEQLTASFFTQLMPSNRWPLRSQLRQMVYAALVD